MEWFETNNYSSNTDPTMIWSRLTLVCTGGSSLVSLPCQRCRETDWLSNSGFSDGNWQQRNPDLVLHLRAKFTSRATLSVHSLYFTLSGHSLQSLCKHFFTIFSLCFVHNPAQEILYALLLDFSINNLINGHWNKGIIVLYFGVLNLPTKGRNY